MDGRTATADYTVEGGNGHGIREAAANQQHQCVHCRGGCSAQQSRPRRMELIHLNKGTIISNDGATIMKLLDIVHPTAKILVDITRL
ncbi:unnamed protein product [Calypogeia fissa]